jgi:hypothetical protein
VFLRAKTHTFFSIFSSSKVPRLEVQVRAPSPFLDWGSDEACTESLSDLFADADEGGDNFSGDADEADDPPEDPKPVETVSPQTRPSLTE